MVLASSIDALDETFQVVESRQNSIYAYFHPDFYTVNPYWNFRKMQLFALRVIKYFFEITFLKASISGSEKDIFKVL